MRTSVRPFRRTTTRAEGATAASTTRTASPTADATSANRSASAPKAGATRSTEPSTRLAPHRSGGDPRRHASRAQPSIPDGRDGARAFHEQVRIRHRGRGRGGNGGRGVGDHVSSHGEASLTGHRPDHHRRDGPPAFGTTGCRCPHEAPLVHEPQSIIPAHAREHPFRPAIDLVISRVGVGCDHQSSLGASREKAIPLHRHLKIRVPGPRLTAAADAPNQRTSLGLLDDERDRRERQPQRRPEHLVVDRRVSEFGVSDGSQQLSQARVVDRRPTVVRAPRAPGALRRQTALTFCASSPLRPGATSNSTR
jgi:hypothetical protein